MSQITSNLWLGGADDAYHHGFIERKKITHILNCAEELGPEHDGAYKEGVTVYHLPMVDDDYLEAERDIRDGAKKIEELLSEGHTILVHCRAGVSRSATLVIAWYILFGGLSYDDAYECVSKARNIIFPNWDFQDILKRLK